MEQTLVASSLARAKSYVATQVPRYVLVFLALDLCMGALFFVQGIIPESLHLGTFHLDGEQNLPAWYASMQLFVVGFLFSGYVYRTFDRAERSTWVLPLVPAMFFFLSLDEAARIHEKLGLILDTFGSGSGRILFAHTGIWMLVCAPLLMVSVVVVGRLSWSHWRQHPVFVRRFCIGMATLLLGATGVEILQNWVVRDSTVHVAQIFLEETLEMVGATIVLWSVASLLRDTGISLFGTARRS